MAPRTSIRFAPIVAILLAVGGMLVGPVSPVTYPVGVVLGSAALLVGGVSAFNTRREPVNLALGVVAAGLGAVTLVWMLSLLLG